MVLSFNRSEGAGPQNRMMRWALEHPQEWDVVLGFVPADSERITYIGKMLTEAGFSELPELMAMRAYRLLSENGDGSS